MKPPDSKTNDPKAKKRRPRLTRQDLILAFLVGLISAVLSYYWALPKVSPLQGQPEIKPLAPALQARWIMEDDIAHAGFDPRAKFENRQPLAPWLSATATQLRLQGDFNLSGKPIDEKGDESVESVVYVVDAANKKLYRNQSVLLDNLVELNFNYQEKPQRQVQISWLQVGAESVKFVVNGRNPE